MIIIKEIYQSLVLGIGIAGILTILFINNPKTWYKTAKKIKQKIQEEKNRKKNDIN